MILLPERAVDDPHFSHVLKPDDPRTAGEVNVGERCKGRVEKLHDVIGSAGDVFNRFSGVESNVHITSYTLQGNVL